MMCQIVFLSAFLFAVEKCSNGIWKYLQSRSLEPLFPLLVTPVSIPLVPLA